MRILIAVLFMAVFTGGAAAQSCSQLQAELASAQSGQPDTAAIARLQRQYGAFGCNSSGSFGRNAQCGRIEAQMRAARQGVDRRRVSQLQARVARACRQQQHVRSPGTRVVTGHGDRVTVVNVDPGQNIFSSIFGGRERIVVREVPETVAATPEADVRQRRETTDGGRSEALGVYRIGNARTICVRLCDGFYFPINSTSRWQDFNDELAMCVGRCPGADVSLYAHDRDAPVESMRSAMTGEHYVSLPTAFLYRTKRVANCGCEPKTLAKIDSAEEALSFVGEGSGDAEAAVRAAAADARLTAVFDETGKPLHETLAELRRTRADTPPMHRPSEAPVSATPAQETAETVVEEPAEQAVAASSVSLRVREVGPQFYSARGEAVRAEQRIARPFAGSNAVLVVPVASSAVVIERDKPGKQPEAAVVGEEPLPENASGEAQTSSLAPSPSGG